MEKYRVLQRLGKGAQGSVFLVEKRSNGKNYVMKKVECKDECEANKAFREAMALKELQHPNICGYREFFVMWDKEISSMFVCIVMDYYESGDLSQILREKRQAKEHIEEGLIQRWLGQILEILVFIHRRNIIHRDLKPSNVFLHNMTELVVGDFGVATIMAEARNNTRAVIGSMNWMAPEVLERTSDERSDVWSLGCIALEMVTCAFIDVDEMPGKLFEIKHSVDTLDAILKEVSKSYSEELVELIGKMLQRNFTRRLTAIELSEKRYMRECIAMNVVGTEYSTDESSSVSKPVPEGEGMDVLIAYMSDQLTNATSMQKALEYLCSLAENSLRPLDIHVEGRQAVAAAMRAHLACVDVQIAGCKLLRSLASAAHSDDLVYSPQVIGLVLDAMKKHVDSAELNLAAVDFLVAVAADEGACAVVGNLGGVKRLAPAMKQFTQNVQVATSCCNAIWSLSVNEDNCRMVANAQCIRIVYEVLVRHPDSSELVAAAFAALMSMFMEDRNVHLANSLNGVLHIMSGIERHLNDAKVVKHGCLALATIIESDEESAFHLFRDQRGDEEIEGIPILIRAYQQHKDNADVVESICMTFMELVEYDEIRAEMKHLNIHTEILSKVQSRFTDNNDILSSCETALKKMELSR